MAITYAPTTNFGLKDSLPTNDSDKVIRGSEFTTEFTAIQTAFSLAAPTASPTFTGTVTIPTADINGGNIDGTIIGAATPAAGSFTTGQFGTSLNVDGTVTADGAEIIGDVAINTTTPATYLHIVPTDGELNDAFTGFRISRSTSLKAAQHSTYSHSGGSATITSTVTTGGAGGSFRVLSSADGTTTKSILNVSSNNDFSLYEDTGTTPKFFWDASAEALQLKSGSLLELERPDGAISSKIYMQAGASGGLAFDNLNGDGFEFKYAGVDQVVIDSSGRLLVGTTSNFGGEALQVDANSVGSTVYTAYISNTSTSTSAYNVMRWAQGAAGSATGMIGTGGSATGNTAFRNNFVVGTQSSSPLVFSTADTERARIDSSGNLLVGTTNAVPLSDDGAVLGASGYVYASRDGDIALFANRLNSDGDIAIFRKDGTTVGSIGTNGNLYIQGPTGTSGAEFANNAVRPWKDGARVDATVDLGVSGGRFKDLYLSGGVYLGGTGAANKLDDYEEGTWTPSGYSGWATNPTSVSAAYTKIGRLVMLTVKFTGGSFNNQCYLTGVPFSEVKEGTAPVVNGSISVSATAMVASGDRIWFNATNGQTSDGSQFSVVYETT